jgi:putative nucleotidyltransferase with HDIG domain
MPFSLPKEVKSTLEALEKTGFEAYLVGGCTRDLLLNKKPKDWDITTNAKPEEIINLFPKTFYENNFGTVTVVFEESKDETLKNIEITPYRKEGKYSDKRHPDSISFSASLEEDLSRRDFTINALAYNPSKGQVIDLYKGQEDIKDKIIRTVGIADSRFEEDALRLIRSVRLATELDFTIEEETKVSIQNKAYLIKDIAIERIRDEIVKIVMSKKPIDGFYLLEETGLLQYILPEFREGIGMEQNEAHSFHVWEHTLKTMQHSADKDWPLHVRLGALFHDVGKPKTREWSEKKNNWTFYGHDVVGAKITKRAMERLKFSREMIEIVTKLVRYHLFFSDVDKITMSAVRRIVRNMGKDYIWDLMKVRACDRIGTGRPKETPYRLRKYEAMIEEAMRDPISVGMLKINGQRIIEIGQIEPGPKIGQVLNALLGEILDDPLKNIPDYLEKRTLELLQLGEKDLLKLAEKGKENKDEVEGEVIKNIRKSHWVD